MRCGHKNWAAMEWNGKRWETWPARTDAIICLRCGEWLPMGPATDTERTAVEVRAAELASMHDCAPQRSAGNGWHHAEDMGWLLRGAHDVDVNVPRDDHEWAGWLARCIAEHEPSRRESGG